ncbi:hypothetical protein BN439_3339 [Erwinia amylovora Ea644]|nr:hypothetical protein BN439_3339 [Erwinia amylovora Ea644]CCP08435.1 hypothetical protein BN440_3439 [Erwinia amylovora MR1]
MLLRSTLITITQFCIISGDYRQHAGFSETALRLAADPTPFARVQRTFKG